MQWPGSPVKPVITDQLHTTPAINISADNVTLQGLNIAGNTYAGTGRVCMLPEHPAHPLQGLTITDCTFSRNEAGVGSGGNGGCCLHLLCERLPYHRTTFTGNRAGEHGGGCHGIALLCTCCGHGGIHRQYSPLPRGRAYTFIHLSIPSSGMPPSPATPQARMAGVCHTTRQVTQP